ncbi:hypothetical protein KEM55_006171 [Ascosphaera atra]|nr:hypothetical protein KEM55_006171 [Ascosphaera atra]
MSALRTMRAKVLTGSLTVAVMSGALYGAGLKSNNEEQQKLEEQRKQTPEESLRFLEAARADLVVKRDRLDKQIQDVKARQEKRRLEREAVARPTKQD